jgi:hypothetical protein
MTKYLPLLFLFVFIFFSCSDKDQTFEIGNKYVDVKTNLRFVDTLTVNSFSVRLDSIHTSTYKTILIGKHDDPELGEIWARSYFRVGLPSSIDLPNDAVFDSVQLILSYNKYYVGDTMNSCTIKVHRLTQIMKATEDGYLYNTSSFSYNPDVFGSVTFMPRPNSGDSVKITIDPAFGNQLFDLCMDENVRITNLDNFLYFLKGLVVSFDDASDIILGFKSSTSIPMIRIYYQYFDYDVKHKYLDFPMIDANLQFIEYGINNPKIEFPQQQKYKLPVQLTNNVSYIQGGLGIVTRLEIPFLRSLLELHQNIKVLRAVLVMEPLKNSYRHISLPDSISLYYTDNQNRFVSAVLDKATQKTELASLTVDEVFQEDTKYTIEITDFINYKLTEESDDTPALLVIITPNRIYKTVDRLILGSQLHTNNDIQLKIYYMDYE